MDWLLYDNGLRHERVKEEQHRYSKCQKSELSKQQLSLKLSEEGYPKKASNFHTKRVQISGKLIEEAHIQTIRGGVTLTTAKIRSKYWVPTLRQLVKRVLRICYGCKKFHVKSYPVPQKMLLAADRTNLDLSFKIIGTDYAEPFLCKSKGKKERKVYLLLFTCSLSRAIHLEMLPNQTAQ